MGPQQKEWIDNASYATLLYRWRFAASGDTIFQDESGEYYKKIMFEKRDALAPGGAAQVSKEVGWE